MTANGYDPTPTRAQGPLVTALKWVSPLGLARRCSALVVAVAVAIASLPDYASCRQRSDLGQMIRVRAADGTVLVSLGPSFGQWLRYDEIPPTMRAAMIAVEDKRFRSHLGVDPIGVARSVKVRFESGRWRQGGSTITQQLARNIFLTNSRTFGRKVKEGVLALAIERKFTKDQILELYLNRVYFGGGAYGIDAAVAPLLRPWRRPAEPRRSGDHRRAGQGAVQLFADRRCRGRPRPRRRGAQVDGRQRLHQRRRGGRRRSGRRSSVQPTAKQNSVRYFTDWALPQLDTLIDETSEPIDVWTTLDPGMQAAADRAISGQHPEPARRARWSRSTATARCGRWSAAAIMSIRIYNRATQAERQPGSAFKLFVYLAALEAGMKPTDTIVDEPVTIDGWTPRNSTRTYLGPVTLREAFARSINTISAKIGEATRLRDDRRHGAALRDSAAKSRPIPRWCWGPATCA